MIIHMKESLVKWLDLNVIMVEHHRNNNMEVDRQQVNAINIHMEDSKG